MFEDLKEQIGEIGEMNRTQAAEFSGFSRETLRYYEEIGLVVPRRNQANYRVYTDQDLLLLYFIQEAKSLRFSLKEIGDILQAVEVSENLSLEEVITRKIHAMESEILALQTGVERLKEALNVTREGKCWLRKRFSQKKKAS